MSTKQTDKGVKQNSAGVLGNANRALSNISHSNTTGAFCNHVAVLTGAICPRCGNRLHSVSRIIRTVEDHTVEIHLATPSLEYTAHGCGFHFPSQPRVQKARSLKCDVYDGTPCRTDCPCYRDDHDA